MPPASNQPVCGVCASKLVKNGKTSAGRTRWRCKRCGASTTVRRPDASRRASLGAFLSWLLGTRSQQSFGGTGRSFRAWTAWCWRIPVPPPPSTGEIHQQLMLDGTYFNGWCVLIAYTGTHVVDWQWCDQEKKAAWLSLMARIPAPRVAIIDGGAGALAAISEAWPDTAVQRCYFHIARAIRRHLTYAPRLPAGKELAALVRALMNVADQEQAATWLSQYSQWEARWDTFLKHRSYERKHSERPAGISDATTWWYTHTRLRRARGLLRRLIRDGHLFTWLNTELQSEDGSKIHRTTSPLEGGPNKAIKDLLRHHRGLPDSHARRAVDWKLESLTANPRDPWSVVEPQHWAPTQPTPVPPPEPLGPAEYDTAFSPEDGNGIQHGWAGRSRP